MSESKLVGSNSRPSVDDEVFEISDFTVVTEWERFIVNLESVLHDWQLNKKRRYAQLQKVRRYIIDILLLWIKSVIQGQLVDCDWQLVTQTVSVSKWTFTLEYHKAILPTSEETNKEETVVTTSGENIVDF